MAAEYTFDWLGQDWLKLKSQLVRLCARHVDVLLDTEDQYSRAGFQRFRDAVLEELRQRAKPDKDASGLWSEALGLLAEFDALGPILERELGRKKAQADPVQVVGQCLRFFLENARRELYALETGETSGRIKTWERLDRISKSLVRLDPERETDRCSDEHFSVLHAYIKEHHNQDYNYPQKLSSIKDFFHLFCECCRNRTVDVEQDDVYSLTSGGISPLVDSLMDGRMEDILWQCLQQLTKQEMEIMNIEFKLDTTGVTYMSATAYRRETGISKRSYDMTKLKVLQQLLVCLGISDPMAVTGERI